MTRCGAAAVAALRRSRSGRPSPEREQVLRGIKSCAIRSGSGSHSGAIAAIAACAGHLVIMRAAASIPIKTVTAPALVALIAISEV
ncbi:hypothetical protein S58_72560 [Bradyrhizobium oligotrophicum S58]|uniref:Uncharacterized protein n=1 Tax=Bradyrhizobium oligotrophicum S58 TaxID=1245469 RepID=M5A2U1_9BRAD|nr:hypothetical protein S58_72560 [Bradyrhizobium oligotrophicum S58]